MWGIVFGHMGRWSGKIDNNDQIEDFLIILLLNPMPTQMNT